MAVISDLLRVHRVINIVNSRGNINHTLGLLTI